MKDDLRLMELYYDEQHYVIHALLHDLNNTLCLALNHLTNPTPFSRGHAINSLLLNLCSFNMENSASGISSFL